LPLPLAPFTGHNAVIDLQAVRDVVLGDLATGLGGELTATGSVQVQAGAAASGIGLETTASSRIVADATGTADATGVVTWAGAAATGDGLVRLQSDGDIVLRGAVLARDPGADIGIVSRSQVFIGGLVRADDRLELIAGTDVSRVAVRVDRLVTNAQGGY